MKWIKQNTGNLFLLSFCLTLLAVTISLAPAHAISLYPIHAVGSDSTGDACNGLNQLGGTSCGGGQGGINKVVSGVVTIISYLAGIIAIVMVIVSGVRYTTSGGDSAKVGAAKTALVYALIGVAIAALAQILVHFVLNQASGVS